MITHARTGENMMILKKITKNAAAQGMHGGRDVR